MLSKPRARTRIPDRPGSQGSARDLPQSEHAMRLAAALVLAELARARPPWRVALLGGGTLGLGLAIGLAQWLPTFGLRDAPSEQREACEPASGAAGAVRCGLEK